MPVIVVDAAAHCHGPEVVEALARRLGLDRVDDWALFATAADRYGMSPKKLQRHLSEPPSFFGTPRRERVRQVAVLRACIADEVANDGWIYQGLVGHLLPRTLTHVLKVCLAGTHDWRVDRAVDAGLSRRDADRVVSRDDETRAEWTSLVADSGPWDTSLYDVFLPMHEHSIDEAVEMLAGYATQPVLAFTPAVQRAIRDFQLAAAVGVALTEKGHDVDVEANDGRVTILIKHHSMFLERHQKELEEIAGSVGGVTSASARPGPDYTEPGVAFKVELDVPSKVLLVDDEREFVHTLSERLQSRRFTPAIAYDGEQALEMVRNDEPEVIVLDLKMPGIDGLEVLRRVKRTNPRTEVIILTGHGSDREEEIAAELGAFAYLRKPVDLDVLTDTMKAAYRKVSAADEEPADDAIATHDP
jgi:CheY-like chemotaxis protein